jgi:hypothetical protein
MLVFCNGMPRAGSTLQYNLVANLVEASGTGAASGGMENTGGTEDGLRAAATADRTLVYKTHDVLPHVVPWIERGEVGVLVCYIYRDLRDVAVSLREKHGPNESHMFELLDDAVATYDILSAVRESPHVLWQRYEDVMADARAATAQVADFLGIEVAPAVAERIAADCSVDSARGVMQTVQVAVKAKMARATPAEMRQIRKGVRDGSFHAADPETLIHWNHISRFAGASGVWRAELPAPLVAAITGRYADWYTSAGYELEGDGAPATEGAAQ